MTECITVTSVSPTKGPNARRPEALGETISFGHADGQRVHRGGAQQGALRAAEAEDAADAAIGVQAQAGGPDALEHQLDGGAARARAAHVVEVVPARAGHLLAA